MHIMEIISTNGVNGAVMHGTMVARELARRGHRVTVVCLPNSWCSRQLRQEPIQVVESTLRRWPMDQLIRIGRLSQREHVDVIHTHLSRANFFGQTLSWLSGIPCVATAHNHCIQLNWMFHDRVIAPSKATGRFQRIYNFVRASRLEIVHNFVDHRCFPDNPGKARPDIRAALGIDGECLVIGIVGDIIPRKGLIYLVSSLTKIKSVIPSVRLLVVGDGPSEYMRKVKSKADRLGVSSSILWAGHRSDVPQILRSLDVFVLPSIRESFPIAVLEAMAVGLPVVASSVAGLPECIIPGKTGYLVPPASHRALADAIIPLLEDRALRERFGASGRERVLNHFSIERQLPKIEFFLSRVVRKRKKGLYAHL